MRLAYSILCDYGPDNYQSLRNWLTANCQGKYHMCYTTDPQNVLPQIKFQYKQDATNFEYWIKTDSFQVVHQQYLNDAIANKTKWEQQQWRYIT